MFQYKAPVDKYIFLQNVFGYKFDDFDYMLQGAATLAEDEYFPTNSLGDRYGCQYNNGKVKVPEEFHEPFSHFRSGGWSAWIDGVVWRCRE